MTQDEFNAEVHALVSEAEVGAAAWGSGDRVRGRAAAQEISEGIARLVAAYREALGGRPHPQATMPERE